MTQLWHHPASGVALAYVTGPVRPGEYVSVPDGRSGLAIAGETVWWFGPATRPWVADRMLDTVVGIRLTHLAGRPFADTSLAPWCDARVELGHLPSHAASSTDLRRALQMASTPRQQAVLLVAYASRRVGADTESRGDGAARILAGAAAGEPVAVTAAELAISPRQMHRRSLEMFGMPPTTLRRILRIHRAASVRVGGTEPTLATVAAEAGFSDQAHLARDTQALTLTTSSLALGRGRVAVSDSFKTSGSTRP